MSSISLSFFAATDRGLRRVHNEDYHLFCTDLSLATPDWASDKYVAHYNPSEKGSVLLVADGMGGTAAGEVASKLTVESIRDYFERIKEIPDDIELFMKYIILETNSKLTEYQEKNPETRGMGTTLVLAWVLKNILYLAWVGDSRAYCYNKQKGLRQLSKDHSLVQELVDNGEISAEQAFNHPHSNIITQYMGNDTRSPVMGYKVYTLQDHDRILLCTDGLNGMLTDQQISDILECYPDTDKCGKELITAANAAGGNDNITVILFDYVLHNSATGDNLLQ